jgi:hypothetical protein
MLYVKIVNNLPVEISDKYVDEYIEGPEWKSRWDWSSLDEVSRLALYITAMTGETYIGTDRGSGVSPRYDIIRVPAVGDKVSYGFNGDYYPDGEIVKVTKKLQVTTSTGSIYRQRKNSSSWVKAGGTWSLVAGHVYQQNPHF